MRCFLAIDLPEEARHEVTRIQKLIPEQGIKFVEKENLHLTLKFFGEIDDYKISEVKKALKEFKFEKINCELGGIGFFPSSSYIRVIWIALEPGSKIKEMQEKIEDLLAQNGFKKEKRFESHVTLARAKFVKDKEQFLKKIKEIEVKPIAFPIDSFSLKKSTLTEKGPVYEEIVKF